MAYEPEFNVFDSRKLQGNLIKFFVANQKDALLWANNGERYYLGKTKNPIKRKIEPLKEFYPSEPSDKLLVVPSLTFIQDDNGSEIFDDFTETDVTIFFEIKIVDGERQIIKEIAKIYELAYKSMVRNCPSHLLSDEMNIDCEFKPLFLNTEFEIVEKNANKFRQSFQIEVTWTVDFQNNRE